MLERHYSEGNTFEFQAKLIVGKEFSLGKRHKKKPIFAIFYIKRCVGEHSLMQHCTIIILLYANKMFKKDILSIVSQLRLVLL